jgi:tyrosyl-tRNA synthetase
MICRDIDMQVEAFRRGAVDLINEAELRAKLEKSIKNDRPLLIKAGFDPTAPDLHLGHTIVMNKMRQFQDFGHEAVFVVGDFTAMIGDPTGKNVTRPPLTKEQVMKGAETYAKQAFKILDQTRARIEYNSSWLSTLGAEGLIRLASRYTVARMLEREDFKNRFHGQVAISIHEFLYPLLQAYDSVALRADIELGGGDQLFNLVIGRSIQKEYGQEPQVVLTTPLLEGLDAKMVDGKLTGNKMSKSLGNYVGITELPQEMFGKLMSVTDDLMWRYYELMSALPMPEISAMKKSCADGTMNPRDAKAKLASEIIERFHSKDAAKQAQEEFSRVFANKEIPDDIKVVEITAATDRDRWLPKIMVDTALAGSTSEVKRILPDGGVKVDGKPVTDWQHKLDPGEHLVQRGQRKFVKVVIK